jgi:hypothetical protein
MKSKERISMFIIILTIIIPIPPPAISAELKARTELSKKASKLTLDFKRRGVINYLGPPTWAIIPGDTGDWALPDPRIAFELYWKNAPYFPVAVPFNWDEKVTGWNAGYMNCGEQIDVCEPEDEHLCTRPDRSKYCDKNSVLWP